MAMGARAKINELKVKKAVSKDSYRILLVDDDKFLLEFFARVLSAQGYVTVRAGNGIEAEDILNSDDEAFDLVIVDLLMPVKSGWKLIESLKNSSHDLPIIALTGLSLSYDEYERIREMTSAVMLKGDFEVNRFVDTIKSVLGVDAGEEG